MEISAIEIQLLCQKISESTSGYFLGGIYSIESGILLRLAHSNKPEKLVAISSFAPWITSKNLSVPQASKFVSRLRDKIERFVLVSVEQVGNERIARFEFKSKKEDKRNLYAEFFARGNIILADPEKEETILDVAEPQRFRHRTLILGEKYVLPPSRGVPLQEINESRLISIFTDSSESIEKSNLSAIKWFGRNIGTSRKFVEEVFWKSKVNPEIPAKSLSREKLFALSKACESLILELRQSSMGYVLIPKENADLDVDVCQIIPHSWQENESYGLASIKSYSSLNEALDEVQIQALIVDRQRQASLHIRAKGAELASAITKQKSLIARNMEHAKELRTIASSLIRTTGSEIGEEILSRLRSYELVEELNGQLRFIAEPRTSLKSLSYTSLASRLFDEAKRLETANRKLSDIVQELELQRDALSEQTKSKEARVEKNLITERRERQWYERYRWFKTSDMRLAVGGRDSTSNSVIINKYLSKDDIVFHADLHGSPFFLLKNGMKETLRDEIALELAQATVGFSRAWKDELGSADAYWVFPEQIKKSAPSGEYLPRGSFFIEGKKNFVRHVKVELSVGISSASNLPREGNLEDIGDLEAKPEQIFVVCGPDKSIGNYCLARVKIAPGKEKSTDVARRIKQQLVSKVKDEILKIAIKKVAIDEIIRVLPSGSYKIVSDKTS